MAFGARRGNVDPDRLWATLLCLHALRTFAFSWLIDEEENITIVDLGARWAAKQADILWGELDENGRRSTAAPGVGVMAWSSSPGDGADASPQKPQHTQQTQQPQKPEQPQQSQKPQEQPPQQPQQPQQSQKPQSGGIRKLLADLCAAQARRRAGRAAPPSPRGSNLRMPAPSALRPATFAAAASGFRSGPIPPQQAPTCARPCVVSGASFATG